MSGGQRVSLETARLAADELIELVAESCHRYEVAGSIRRQERTVGDIELVVIPKMTSTPVQDMFGTIVSHDQHSQFDERCAELLADATFELRRKKDGTTAWGPQAKFGIFRGVAIDLYSTTWESWGVTLLLRTGPSDFSRRLVTDKRHGGLCPSELHFAKSRLRHRHTAEAIETPDEKDVFEAMGYGYVRPEARLPSTTPPSLAFRR